MPIVQVIIDDSTDKTIAGSYDFDSSSGARLKLPRGTSFPGSPETDDSFYRTDQEKWYRYTGSAWAEIDPADHTHTESDITDLDHDAVKIQGRNVDSTAPTDGQVLAWNNSGSQWEPQDQSGSGTSDHGSLTGLGDDDHTQYHNDTRGDARYYRENEHISSSSGAGDAGKPIVLDAGGQVDATMVNPADMKLDDLASPDDNTDLNVSTSVHGLCPKLDNNSDHFLNGQGSWATPSGGSSSISFDMMREIVLWEDFPPTSLDDQQVGSNGWNLHNDGGSCGFIDSSVIGYVDFTEKHGCLNFNNNTTDGHYSCYIDKLIEMRGTNDLSYEVCICPWRTDGLTSGRLKVLTTGICDDWAVDDEPDNGIYVRFDPSSDTYWTLVASDSGTKTTLASNVTPAINTWYAFEVTIQSVGSSPTITWKVNGSSQAGSITTNCPTGIALGPGIKLDSSSTHLKSVMIDRFYIRHANR